MVELLERVETRYPDLDTFDVDAFLKKNGISLESPPRSYLLEPQMLLAFPTLNRVTGLPVKSDSKKDFVAAIKGRYGTEIMEASYTLAQADEGFTLEGTVTNIAVAWLSPWPEEMGMNSRYFHSLYDALKRLSFNSGSCHLLKMGHFLPVGDGEQPFQSVIPLNL